MVDAASCAFFHPFQTFWSQITTKAPPCRQKVCPKLIVLLAIFCSTAESWLELVSTWMMWPKNIAMQDIQVMSCCVKFWQQQLGQMTNTKAIPAYARTACFHSGLSKISGKPCRSPFHDEGKPCQPNLTANKIPSLRMASRKVELQTRQTMYKLSWF